MKTIRIDITDAEYEKLCRKASDVLMTAAAYVHNRIDPDCSEPLDLRSDQVYITEMAVNQTVSYSARVGNK